MKVKVIEKPIHARSKHEEIEIILPVGVEIMKFVAQGWVVDYRGKSLTHITDRPRVRINEKGDMVLSMYNPARIRRTDLEDEAEFEPLPRRFM